MAALELMIFSWYADDNSFETDNFEENSDDEGADDDDEKKYYHIYLFGITKEGKSVCIEVKNFTPFFYVKYPQHWPRGYLDNFIKEQKNKIYYKDRDHVLKHQIIEKKDAYGFNNGAKFNFIRFVFDNMKIYNRMKWNIKKNDSVELYNSNIDPMLVFMHIRNIEASGWIKIDKSKLKKSQVARVDLCYSTKWTNINALQRNEISPLKILSFDIESYSSTGDFPVPSNIDDAIIQIGSTIQRFGESDVKKHVVVLGECDPVENTEIVQCNSEENVLEEWCKFVQDENPDLIVGYNIHGFDWEYITGRCRLLSCQRFIERLSRLYHVPSKMDEAKLESSAFGMNNFRFVDTPGINQIDLYYYFRKQYKLSSYKLDNVAKHFLNEQKRPVTPQQIFSMGGPDGTAKSRSTVADYCAQDTMLPLRLMENQLILTNLIEMSKCTSVPLTWLISRGEQIKVYSQVQRELRKEGYLFPEKLKFNIVTIEKYEGATVLNCERGAHLKFPTSGLDFKSLYPSIIIAHNLCITTLVLDPQYLDLPGVEYTTFEWDSHKYFIAKKSGIIPRIVDRLWKDRDSVKREMKQEKNPGIKSVLNAKQLAIKLSMNSIYGVFGAKNGYLCMKPIAMIITYVGRTMIEHSKKCAETFYDGTDTSNGIKAHVVYGDSVPGHMPVIVNDRNKHIFPRRIDSMNSTKWHSAVGGKEQSYPDPNIHIWCGNGWVKPIRIIRHKTVKKIYRVVTQKGIVECTEDHSLFRKYTNEQVKPNEVMIGDELLHRYVQKKKPVTNTTNPVEERRKQFYAKFN